MPPTWAVSRTKLLDRYTYLALVTSNIVGSVGASFWFIRARAISASGSEYGRIPRTSAQAPMLSANGATRPEYATTFTRRCASSDSDSSISFTRSSGENRAGALFWLNATITVS